MKDEEMVHKLRAANEAAVLALANITEASLLYKEIKDQTGHDFQEGQFCQKAYEILRKAVFKDPGEKQ